MDAAMYDCMAMTADSPVVSRGIALHKMVRMRILIPACDLSRNSCVACKAHFPVYSVLQSNVFREDLLL